MLVKRRYFWKGPQLATLALEIGPSVKLPESTFVVAFDIQYDDTAADAALVDSLAAQVGGVPDPSGTTALSPAPFLGVIAPGGDVWALRVDLLGILTTQKVS